MPQDAAKIIMDTVVRHLAEQDGAIADPAYPPTPDSITGPLAFAASWRG